MSQAETEDGRQSLGITMLSVLLGVAVTVALGIQAEWWVRTLVGVGVSCSSWLRSSSEPAEGGVRYRSSPCGC